MKTLANCSPREFLVQTNKIRHAVSEWLSLTKLMEIRKDVPKEDATKEEIEAHIDNNIRRMLDAILDEHPNETAELLGLMCFIEPDDLDNHPMSELLGAATDILNCPEVMGFFTSLTRWESRGTSDTAKA